MLSQLSKNLIIPSLVFFLLSLGGFLYFNKMVADKSEEILRVQTEAEKEIARFENIKGIDRSMRGLQTKIDMFETHFIKSSDVVPFLDSIEELASSVSAKAEITSVDTGKVNSYLIVSARANGSFASLYKFLTLIENSNYQTEFVSMDIQKMGGESVPGGEWEARIKLKLLTFLP